jgi:signal peptidase II
MVALLGLDQLVKYLTTTLLMGQSPYVVIENVFELLYTTNRGAAFGMMQGWQVFFIIMTVLFLVAIIFFWIKIPRTKRYIGIRISTVFIIPGALGNLIDRARQGYVVDTFYFKPINFPVFNMADSYTVIACFLFAFLVLFYYKEDEFAFIGMAFKELKRKLSHGKD